MGIYKLNKRDFIVTAVTILVTLFLGIDFGVALGVVASIVLFIQKSAKPHYSILGKMNLSGDKAPVYRNVKMYPSATKRPDMLMIRWDAPIFFANTASFKSRVKKHIGRFLEENNYPKPWCLCLCFSGVNDVDFTGLEMLEAFFSELQEKEHGMTLVLCKLKTQVLNALTKGEVISPHCVPKEHVLWEIHEAEKWWDNRLETMETEDMGKAHPMHGHHVADHSAVHGFATADHVVTPEDDDDEINQV